MGRPRRRAGQTGQSIYAEQLPCKLCGKLKILDTDGMGHIVDRHECEVDRHRPFLWTLRPRGSNEHQVRSVVE